MTLDQVVAVNQRTLWAARSVPYLRSHLIRSGLDLPQAVLVSVDACSTPNALGECHPACPTTYGTQRIVVQPTIDQPARLMDVLLHELMHAMDNCRDEHGPQFAARAAAVGLRGPFSTTTAGRSLSEYLGTVTKLLGPLPPPFALHLVAPSGAILT